jgi:hypothetical protein
MMWEYREALRYMPCTRLIIIVSGASEDVVRAQFSALAISAGSPHVIRANATGGLCLAVFKVMKALRLKDPETRPIVA